MKAKTKRVKGIEIMLAVMLFWLMAWPAQAAAAERSATADGAKTVVTWTFLAGEEPPEIAQQITEQGVELKLVSTETQAQVDDTYEHPQKAFTGSITQDINIADINRLAALFPATYHISEGEYVGEIGLASSPYTVEEVYESFTGQVDRAYDLTGLPDNDYARLPEYMDFDVRSDAGPSAAQVATLKLIAVEYELIGTNELGRPNNYTAHLTFRGAETYLVLHHYRVTANYASEIASNVDRYTIVATYEPVPAAAAAVSPVPPEPQALEEAAVPLAAPVVFHWGQTAAAVTVAVALSGVAFFFIRRGRRFKVYAETEKGPRLIKRLPIHYDKERCVVSIPEGMALEYVGTHFGVAPAYLVKRAVPLRVFQAGVVLYDGPAQERVPLECTVRYEIVDERSFANADASWA